MKVTKTNRIIIIDRMQLADLLLAAAKTARAATLIDVGKLSPFLSQKKAYEIYGEMNVRNWVKWGKVDKVKDGDKYCKVRLSRLELEAAAEASNRCEYFLNL